MKIGALKANATIRMLFCVCLASQIIGHVFWASWCTWPFVQNFQEANPSAEFTLGDYNPIVTYAPCPMGEIWKPANTSCFACYCINSYVSRCFLNPNCSFSNLHHSPLITSTSASTPKLTEVVSTEGTTITKLTDLQTTKFENDDEPMLVTTITSIVPSPVKSQLIVTGDSLHNSSFITTNSTMPTTTITTSTTTGDKDTNSDPNPNTTSTTSPIETDPAALSTIGQGTVGLTNDSEETTKYNLLPGNSAEKTLISHALPERRLNDLLILSLFNYTEFV